MNMVMTSGQHQEEKMKEYKKEVLGFTAGNFDLLHPGYIKCFKEAGKKI